MTAPSGQDAGRGQASVRRVRAEAAAWIVRLHGALRTPELEAGLQNWLRADPEHARQFERLTQVWDDAARPVPGLPRLQAPAAGAQRPRRRARAAAALAAVLACAAVGLGMWQVHTGTPTYATGVGEYRVVRLQDGTRVALDTDSRIAVSYDDAERRIRLTRGEAWFEVAREPGRPFVVAAGRYRVAALGTTFVVRHEAERTAVTLVEGSVAVGTHEQPVAQLAAATAPGTQLAHASRMDAARVSILSPGQRLTFAGDGHVSLDRPNPEMVGAWRQGEVILDHTPLRQAVAEMNRYDRARLVIDDAAIARLRVSGIYHAGDNAAFAASLAQLHGLAVKREGDRIHLVAGQSRSRR